jgi:NAD(P)H-hydrate repair Nnr-like enzyme with NAD(P)H-hydrate epimerase domain
MQQSRFTADNIDTQQQRQHRQYQRKKSKSASNQHISNPRTCKTADIIDTLLGIGVGDIDCDIVNNTVIVLPTEVV